MRESENEDGQRAQRVRDRTDIFFVQFWHSSALATRRSAREMQSKSGTVYQLLGEMDRESTVKNGKKEEKGPEKRVLTERHRR